MDTATLKEILRMEFGINNEKEFLQELDKAVGIDIGIFTSDFERRQVGGNNYETIA